MRFAGRRASARQARSASDIPAVRVEGFNPLCGDEIVVTIDVEDGVLADIKIAGTGCSISQSSASLMSAAVKGKSLAEVRELIGTTYPAANELVGRLAKIGILTEVTGQARNRRFRYDAYISLFADEPPPEEDQ